MLKDELMLKQLRQARIQEVRKQESRLAERSADVWTQRQDELSRVQQEEEARRLYQEKLAQRDMLLRQRQIIEESMGKAQADAAESERQYLQAQVEKEAILRQARDRAQQRGEAAYATLQEEQQARRRQESYLKECRAEVLVAEAQRAHDRAQKFREEQMAIARQRMEEEARRYVPPGGLVVSGPIDYSKTQFHNPVIVRHGAEGQSAAELAEAEIERKIAEAEVLAAKRESQQQAAAERGTRALTSEILKREQEALLRELRSITAADAELKIKAGQTNPVLYSRCTALAEQQDSAKRRALESDYELLLLKEQKQKPQPRAWQTSQTAAKQPTVPAPDVVEVPLVQEEAEYAPEREQSAQQPEKRVIVINEGARSDPFKPSKAPQGKSVPSSKEKSVPSSKEKSVQSSAAKANLKFPKRAWQPPESSESPSEEEEKESEESEGSEEEEEVRIPVKPIYTAGSTSKDKTKRLYEYEGTRAVQTRKRTPSPPEASASSSEHASPRYGRYEQHESEDEELYESQKPESDHEKDADEIMQRYLKTKKYDLSDEEKSDEERSDAPAEELSEEEKDDRLSDKSDDLRYSVEKPESLHPHATPTGPREVKETPPRRQDPPPRRQEPPLQVTELGASHPPPQMYPMPYMYPVPMYQPVPMFPTYYPPMQPYPVPFAGSGASYGQSLQFSQSSGSSASFAQSSGKKKQHREKSPIKSDVVDETPESSLEAPLASKYSGDSLNIKPKKRTTDNLGLYSAFKTEIAKKQDFTPTLSQLPEEMRIEEPVARPVELKASKLSEEDKLSELDFIESHRSGPKHGGEIVQLEGDSTSLSEAFMARRRDMVAKLSSREAPKVTDHSGKSKAELLEIRKQMMKPQHKTAPANKALVIDFKEEAKKGPKPDLMERLATGAKSKVNKREMLQLTAKNYQQLPEVKKRREEEEKKEALKKRLATAKAYEQKRKESKSTTK